MRGLSSVVAPEGLVFTEVVVCVVGGDQRGKRGFRTYYLGVEGRDRVGRGRGQRTREWETGVTGNTPGSFTYEEEGSWECVWEVRI